MLSYVIIHPNYGAYDQNYSIDYNTSILWPNNSK